LERSLHFPTSEDTFNKIGVGFFDFAKSVMGVVDNQDIDLVVATFQCFLPRSRAHQ